MPTYTCEARSSDEVAVCVCPIELTPGGNRDRDSSPIGEFYTSELIVELNSRRTTSDEALGRAAWCRRMGTLTSSTTSLEEEEDEEGGGEVDRRRGMFKEINNNDAKMTKSRSSAAPLFPPFSLLSPPFLLQSTGPRRAAWPVEGTGLYIPSTTA